MANKRNAPELPKRLKQDAIVEAVFEVRFECQESESVPEIVVGKLAEFETWKDFAKSRTAFADMPPHVRSLNEVLRFQATVSLRDASGRRRVNISANSVSLHRLAPYPGWDQFRPEIETAVNSLFATFAGFRPTRLGLRYTNVFTMPDHGIASVADLDYSVILKGETLAVPQNLNFRVLRGDAHIVLVRVASPEFASGPSAAALSCLVDLDVFTPANWSANRTDEVVAWVGRAHDFEKEQFFELFTREMMARLGSTDA